VPFGYARPRLRGTRARSPRRRTGWAAPCPSPARRTGPAWIWRSGDWHLVRLVAVCAIADEAGWL
jgi:hypothetical protein